MGRAPCCEKMGLKKGPWTPEEDRLLISHIQKHGHANWRALPKQAGLLRCGKSCRLRWINYLRPDIKRGNFSKEEEETIIKLHEMLGNRWSAIAAKLPGRTDNEIKNVWHTHLKKRLKPNQQENSKTISQTKAETVRCDSNITGQSESENSSFSSQHGSLPMSPQPSSSDLSSVTATSLTTGARRQYMNVKGEQIDSLESFPEIDESFWSDAFSGEENSSMPSDFGGFSDYSQIQSSFSTAANMVELGHYYSPNLDDCMDFWYNILITTDGESALPLL